MRESPRIRRLRSDLRGLEMLRAQSSIFEFSVPGPKEQGLPEAYIVRFSGKGLCRAANSEEILLRKHHEISILLGAEYPRIMPELGWRTPIFHPNISGSGVVCLGGYGSSWAPSLSLAELCHMLWDMIRYKNFDVESPYNREAAHWTRTQGEYALPVDLRPLRNQSAQQADSACVERIPPVAAPGRPAARGEPDSIVEAELVESDHPDIVFID